MRKNISYKERLSEYEAISVKFKEKVGTDNAALNAAYAQRF